MNVSLADSAQHARRLEGRYGYYLGAFGGTDPPGRYVVRRRNAVLLWLWMPSAADAARVESCLTR